MTHLIQVVNPKTRMVEQFSPEQFYDRFQVRYTPTMVGSNEMFGLLKRRCRKGRTSGFFDKRRRWLLAYHKDEIAHGGVGDVVIQWTGPRMGFGLFAGHDFREGEFVGLYAGRLVKRKLNRSNSNDYCFRVPTGGWHLQPLMIDAAEEGNETRFINHSSDPNIESIGVPVDDMVQILMRTAAPVKRGEQFFCDYGLPFWKSRSSG
jgi:uncharacterized protein